MGRVQGPLYFSQNNFFNGILPPFMTVITCKITLKSTYDIAHLICTCLVLIIACEFPR